MAMNTLDALPTSMVSVRELRNGDIVLQFFILKAKEPRRTKSGLNYLDLSLGDSTGTIAGKLWSDALLRWGQEFGTGDCVKIEGRVETYKSQLQIVVEKIRRADFAEVPDARALIKVAPCDANQLLEELLESACSVKPIAMAELLIRVLTDHRDAVKSFPAARLVHHAYHGGLIEHVCNVVRKVLVIADLDININRDIAVAGAILHDMGKLLEMNTVSGSRTLQGRLLGHVVLGINLIRKIGMEMGVCEEPWFLELEHIIVSHHGEIEFGAPIKPMTREALLVHAMDDLDAKLKIIDEALEFPDAEGFGPYNKWLQGRPYSGIGRLEEENND